jgi:hypothetical protein
MIYYQISKIYPKKLGQTVGEILGRQRKNIFRRNKTAGSKIDIFWCSPPLQPVEAGGSVKGGKRNS